MKALLVSLVFAVTANAAEVSPQQYRLIAADGHNVWVEFFDGAGKATLYYCVPKGAQPVCQRAIFPQWLDSDGESAIKPPSKATREDQQLEREADALSKSRKK